MKQVRFLFKQWADTEYKNKMFKKYLVLIKTFLFLIKIFLLS